MTKPRRYMRFLAGGAPRHARLYDNGGETIDRYTVVWTGNFKGRDGRCMGLTMSGAPRHPQGVCLHFEYDHVIDYPRYSHLGKKIRFWDLPQACREIVLLEYMEIWRIPFPRVEIEDAKKKNQAVEWECPYCRAYNGGSHYYYDPRDFACSGCKRSISWTMLRNLAAGPDPYIFNR